jgi:TRAP-type uncharacterized transport system fused permease subunit
LEENNMKKLLALVLTLCLVFALAPSAFAESLIFGTAATSGTYYQVGAAIGLAFFGWCGRDLKTWERVVLVPCAIALMLNQPLWANGVGFLAVAVILGMAIMQSKKERRALA